MFNPVNLLSTLVGAGASRPAGGLPLTPPPPPPDFQGAGIPRRRTDRGGGVGRALGCGRACPDSYSGARFGKVVA